MLFLSYVSLEHSFALHIELQTISKFTNKKRVCQVAWKLGKTPRD